jgi:phosphatidylserine decarboxylase
MVDKKKIPILIIVVFVLSILYFYRNPPVHMQRCPNDNSCIYSPCYGTVMDIDKNKISVFLSVWDVHRQYYPTSGVVKSVKEVKGNYSVAYNKEKSEDNYKVVHTVATKYGDIVVTQVAGVLARAISYYKKPGDNVVVGEPLGIIHFGSRVDIQLPKSIMISNSIKKGTRLKAGDILGIYSM